MTDMLNLKTVLISGEHHIHTASCKDWTNKRIYRGTSAESWKLSADSQYDVIQGCGEDIIAEHDPSFKSEAAGVEWYANEVRFFPCTDALVPLASDPRITSKPARRGRKVRSADGTDQVSAPQHEALPNQMGPELEASSAPAARTAKRDAKRDLATRVVLAAAEMVERLDGSELAMLGVDVNDAKAMTEAREEVARTVSLWLHHLPADRDEWVKVLPKPDRSDWR
jgi:hypothetical protein